MRRGLRASGLRATVPGIGAALLPLAIVPVLAGSGGAAADTVSAPPPPGTHAAEGASPDRASSAGPVYLTADLGPVNRSGARGTATATLRGNVLSIRIVTHGLAPGLRHAQHIHIGGRHTCPGPNATGSGLGGQVRSGDARKLVGAIAVSLTTTGDTSPDSSYELDRFPIGNAGYRRTITVSPRVAAELRAGEGVIEQHGVDANHDGRYDGSARSDVKAELPEEVSNSAACGRLQPSSFPLPVGGVAAGGGGTA
jgi:hypothetical protein